MDADAVRKQSVQIGAFSLAILTMLYGGTTYWSGLQAEETLQEQHKIIAGLQLFKVEAHHYNRGWFSSEEHTELSFNKKLLDPYLNLLPEQAKNILNTRLVFDNKIYHGPLPGLTQLDFRPGRAWVNTTFQMSDSFRNMLRNFFGENEPLTITNHLHLTGGGELRVSIPKFNYSEALSGVKIRWDGLEGGTDYSTDYKNYTFHAKLPGLQLDAVTKGHIEFQNIAYQSDTRVGATGVNLGNSELIIENIRLDSRENVPYEIRLNELVHMLTRLRVGEFINPSGELKPSNVLLKSLRYEVKTEEENDFVNTRGKFSFDSLAVNHSSVGPLLIDVSAHHLHGPTLHKLGNALSAIPLDGQDPDHIRHQYIDTLLTTGAPLFTRNPVLEVHSINLKMPSGEIDAKAKVTLNGLVESDLQNAFDFLQKLDAQATIKLPSQTLENLVVAQARNLFMVDASAEDPPNIDEIDDLARNLYASQLAEWRDRHFLSVYNDHINTSIAWKYGQLTIGNQPINMPWQDLETSIENPPQITP